MIKISLVKKDLQSKQALMEIFNPEENKIACALYGGGAHCNELKVDAKLNLWGGRAETNPENDCMLARIISVDSEPAALFNVGQTGNPPTVIDKTKDSPGQVYEFSGLMVKDKFFVNGLDSKIIHAIHESLHECTVDPAYTKAILAFTPEYLSYSNVAQKEFLSSRCGISLSADNVHIVLGENSMHPERFKFEEAGLYECTKWNQEVEKVAHEGWHDSSPCIEWLPKTAVVFDIVGEHFHLHDEL